MKLQDFWLCTHALLLIEHVDNKICFMVEKNHSFWKMSWRNKNIDNLLWTVGTWICFVCLFLRLSPAKLPWTWVQGIGWYSEVCFSEVIEKELLTLPLPSWVLWFLCQFSCNDISFLTSIDRLHHSLLWEKEDILWIYWKRIENSEIMIKAHGKILM